MEEKVMISKSLLVSMIDRLDMVVFGNIVSSQKQIFMSETAEIIRLAKGELGQNAKPEATNVATFKEVKGAGSSGAASFEIID